MSSEQHLLPLLNQSNWTPYPFDTDPANSQNQSEAGYIGWAAYSTQQTPGLTLSPKNDTYAAARNLIDICRVVVGTYVVFALCVFGLLGNIVTIVILKRDPDKESTTVWLLKALAVIDSSYLLFTLLFLGSLRIWYTQMNEISITLYNLIRFALSPMSHVTHSLTIWLVILITIDRYLAICKPLNVSWRNLRRMKITVLVLFVLAALFSTPPSVLEGLMTMHYTKCRYNYANHSMAEKDACFQTYLGMYDGLRIYNVSFYFMFRAIGPLIIIILLNLRITWALRTLKKKREKMMQQMNTERRIAMMLILVVVVFIICQMPSILFHFAYLLDKRYSDILKWPTFYCARQISFVLQVLNSSVNFIIYCLISRRFNRTLYRMSSCHKPERRETAMTAYTTQRS